MRLSNHRAEVLAAERDAADLIAVADELCECERTLIAHFHADMKALDHERRRCQQCGRRINEHLEVARLAFSAETKAA